MIPLAKTVLIKAVALMFVLPVISCSGVTGSTPSYGIENALTLAGDNRHELEKVLAKYSADPADSLKYEAAVFLIENMPYHSSHDDEHLDRYMYDYYRILREVLSCELGAEVAVDSVQSLYGMADLSGVQTRKDIETVDSAYLCDNIEWAFKVWREQPWGKNVSFEDFKEYILPYRVGDEALSYWRADYYSDFNHLLDSLRMSDGPGKEDPVTAAMILSRKLLRQDDCHFSSVVPFSFPHAGPRTVRIKCGSCRELGDYLMYILRSVGIPCASDFMPMLRNENVSHSWVSLSDTAGVLYYQEFADPMQEVFNSTVYNDPKLKVYRNTFSLDTALLDSMYRHEPEVMPFFKVPLFRDVTHEYAHDYLGDLHIPDSLLYKGASAGIAYLCGSSRLSWVPVAWTPFRKKNLVFKNIDRCDIMRVVSLKGDRMVFLSDPFYYGLDGKFYELDAGDSLCDVTVFSKVPLLWDYGFSEQMVGGVFEGSNDPDFKDSDTLYMVREMPQRLICLVDIADQGPYRYVRYRGPDGSYCNVSEVSFFAPGSGTPLDGDPIGTPGGRNRWRRHEFPNAVDGKTWTSFEYKYPSGGWAGLDLGRPQMIGGIAYTHRNRDNYVRPGDTYELYFCDGLWKSAGVQVAESDSLVFHDVPSGALLLLKNLTRGVQACVFSIDEAGAQRWEHF